MSLASIIDCHTHSSFSFDSTMPPKDGITSAIDRGIGGLTFTDHIELGHPNPAWNVPFDIAQRSKEFDQLRQKFAGKAKILKGLELGFQPHIIDEAQKIITNHNFDLVLLSIHVIDNIDLSCCDKFYTGKSKHAAYSAYLDAIYQSVTSFDNFDVIGHIGYLCRYAPYVDTSLNYADYHEKFDALLKKIIANGKGIEVNTGGFRYKLGYPHPNFDTIKRYKELGGTIITIGSDAHTSHYVGDQFDTVLKRLADIGFSHVTYFENRKPIFVKI